MLLHGKLLQHIVALIAWQFWQGVSMTIQGRARRRAVRHLSHGRRLTFAVFAVLATFTAAVAQPSEVTLPGASQQLSGGEMREWILVRWQTIMGFVEECTGGESYQFFSNHRVVFRKCVNRKVSSREERWSIVAGDTDPVLKIADKTYLLRFSNTSGAMQMRLRDRATEKPAETTDMIFSLSKD